MSKNSTSRTALSTAESTDPKLNVETGSWLEIIPEYSSSDPLEQSKLRIQTAALIEENLNLYKDGQIEITDYETLSLEYRKRLFNIIKNTYIKPAFDLATSQAPDWHEHCRQCFLEMLKYLNIIKMTPGSEKFLPEKMRERIYFIAYCGDWHSREGLTEIRQKIRLALKLPARKPATDR
jgi:hypothetical protein